MILMMLAALAAQPQAVFDAELARVSAILPELEFGKSTLESDPAADWIAHLPTVEQRDVAMLVLLSYGQPTDGKTPSAAADLATGLAYLATEAVQNQTPGNSDRSHDADTKAPKRAPAAALRADRGGRAQRALAWGHRLGLCDATFVSALRSLPPPAAPGEPDLRPVVRDLGMLAYNPGCSQEHQG